LTQQALAAQPKKQDGATLGLAYINDIEHNRRNPPAPHFVAQLASVLVFLTRSCASTYGGSMRNYWWGWAILPTRGS
jgi:hypothetical protein